MAVDISETNVQELADEPLIGLAVEWACRPAADALILRHRPWIESWITKRGTALRLSVEDIEDARQRSMVALFEALPSYHRYRSAVPSPKPFREFASRMVANRFNDFIRNLRRLEKHFERSVDVADLAQQTGPLASSNAHIGQGEPLTEALRHESLDALGEFLEQLSEAERQLWDLLELEESSLEIAVAVNVSVATVRRRRQQLFAKIKRFLQQSSFFSDGGDGSG